MLQVSVGMSGARDDDESSSDDGLLAKLGPLKLPGGRGTLTKPQRDEIKEKFGCSANVRQRCGWTERMLTVRGPPSDQLKEAMDKALEFIRQNNANRLTKAAVQGRIASQIASRIASRRPAPPSAPDGAQPMWVQSPRPPPFPPPPPVAPQPPCQPTFTCGRCASRFSTHHCGNCGAPCGESAEVQAANHWRHELDHFTSHAATMERERNDADQRASAAAREVCATIRTRYEKTATTTKKRPKEDIASISSGNADSGPDQEPSREPPRWGASSSHREEQPLAFGVDIYGDSAQQLQTKMQSARVARARKPSITVGVVTMDCFWSDCHDPFIGQKVWHAYDEKFRGRIGDLDCLYHCMDFHDPDAKNSQMGENYKDDPSCIVNHSGEHGTIVARFVYQNAFVAWLTYVKHEIEAVIKEKTKSSRAPKLLIGLFCRSGRHRCVAGGRVLTAIFRALGWWTDLEPIHLARPSWKKRMCHGNCPDCAIDENLMTKEKEDALATACNVWRDV